MSITTARTSFEGLFDDAALFPPARRSMADALAAHDRARRGPHRRQVGPFLCPAERLDELDACVAGGRPRPDRLGVILGAGELPLRPPLSRPGVEQVEAPRGAALPEEARRWRRFVEVPLTGDVAAAVGEVAAQGAWVKVRCGGTGPAAVPAAGRLADVLLASAAHGVQVKATAGLHEPFRTGDTGRRGPGGARHGFLNLLAAASAVVGGADRDEVVDLLEVTGGDDTARVLGRVDPRSRALVWSIGTCSLDEPLGWLVDLGLLG